MISWIWLLLIVPFCFLFGFFLGVIMSNSSHYDELMERVVNKEQP